jgi:hypothetical protein
MNSSTLLDGRLPEICSRTTPTSSRTASHVFHIAVVFKPPFAALLRHHTWSIANQKLKPGQPETACHGLARLNRILN